jgi:hypothetical protein
MVGDNTIELWLSYLDTDAPSHVSGRHLGLGWTQAAASKSAAHHPSQVSWQRFRRITLRDYAQIPSVTQEEEWLVRKELRHLQRDAYLSGAEQEALAHLSAGRFASAWMIMHPVPSR